MLEKFYLNIHRYIKDFLSFKKGLVVLIMVNKIFIKHGLCCRKLRELKIC